MRTWTKIKIAGNLILFATLGWAIFWGSIHGRNAGWVCGFAFCSCGSSLFAKRGYFGESDEKARMTGRREYFDRDEGDLRRDAGWRSSRFSVGPK